MSALDVAVDCLRGMGLQPRGRQSSKGHFPPWLSKIIINPPIVVVIWADNTRTRATQSKADVFDPMVGLAVCIAKKQYGKKGLARLLKRAVVIKNKAHPSSSENVEADGG